eukprot:gene5044-5286_t
MLRAAGADVGQRANETDRAAATQIQYSDVIPRGLPSAVAATH